MPKAVLDLKEGKVYQLLLKRILDDKFYQKFDKLKTYNKKEYKELISLCDFFIKEKNNNEYFKEEKIDKNGNKTGKYINKKFTNIDKVYTSLLLIHNIAVYPGGEPDFLKEKVKNIEWLEGNPFDYYLCPHCEKTGTLEVINKDFTRFKLKFNKCPEYYEVCDEILKINNIIVEQADVKYINK